MQASKTNQVDTYVHKNCSPLLYHTLMYILYHHNKVYILTAYLIPYRKINTLCRSKDDKCVMIRPSKVDC